MKKYICWILFGCASLTVTTAEAQIRRRAVAQDPANWVSGSLGIYSANGISDGATGSTWDFGQASNWQYRVSLERALRNQASIGLTGTYVNVPFVYSGPPGETSCGGCDAHLDLVSLGLSFHVGGGPGLHQVLEASAGAIQYRNLRTDADDRPLAPVGGNVDPFLTFGYGFGYTFNPGMQVSIVQDYGLALHERSGLSSGQSNTLTQRVTRLNFRVGFGSRASGR